MCTEEETDTLHTKKSLCVSHGEDSSCILVLVSGQEGILPLQVLLCGLLSDSLLGLAEWILGENANFLGMLSVTLVYCPYSLIDLTDWLLGRNLSVVYNLPTFLQKSFRLLRCTVWDSSILSGKSISHGWFSEHWELCWGSQEPASLGGSLSQLGE